MISKTIIVCMFMDTVISYNLYISSAGSEVAPVLETNTTFMQFLLFHIHVSTFDSQCVFTDIFYHVNKT